MLSKLMAVFAFAAMIFLGLPAHAASPRAFNLLADGGMGGWLNVTRPLTVADMQGRIVLLDFWTYGCINCMQVVPDLKYLEDTFGDRLLIIGVHSAKFEGERGSGRILAAAQRFGLKHPVINDSDFAIWNSFGVRAWPTLILLDGTGKEIARYEGEGHKSELSNDIHSALAATPAKTATPPIASLIAPDTNKATLSFPARLAYAPGTFWGDVLFVADTGHDRIVGFDLKGQQKITIGAGTPGLKDGDFSTAQFNHPRGLAVFKGDLYVADTANHALRRVDLRTQRIETLAGSGAQGHRIGAGTLEAKSTLLASPWDIEPLSDGKTLALAMAGTHQIWAYDTGRGTIFLLAGSGREDITDGPARNAALAQPSGLSLADGALFFADAESSSLRALEPDGTVKTLIGTGLFDFGHVDGRYPKARLEHPQGLYAGGEKIWIADTYNNALRVYDRTTQTLSTLPLKGGTLKEPGDILLEGPHAYVADTNDHAIKEIDLNTGTIKTLVPDPAKEKP